MITVLRLDLGDLILLALLVPGLAFYAVVAVATAIQRRRSRP